MVKIGKKLKGFDEGMHRVDTYIGEESDGVEKNKIKNKSEKGIDQGLIITPHLQKNIGYNSDIESIEEEKNHPFLLLHEVIENDRDKNAHQEDINFYVERNCASTLLTFLLYKILITKPNNIIEFIVNELGILFNYHIGEGEKMKKKKKKDIFTGICSSNMEEPCKENETDTKLNTLNENDFSSIVYKPLNLINHATFLGNNFLTLSDLFNVLKLIKIENSDKIYFNSLLKILRHFENPQNKDILMKENVHPNEPIPLSWALDLTTTFYNNYFKDTSDA
ncbi:hypothetical protein, conserved [Plasmodium gonderi]|uniref:Uncharacterized protein n=1 Tax=Plasmodium gonderi TaxID=77519 RepID=A0A1Y1JHH2_PLAGO|nr:hypothetical protein, conserved [Plasmodium gonderi]GAW79883.1 hypothetical protein, conserved [Plasmodium gonderi]